ncbi:hypothetical protein F4820DRAFT_436585 [Hypoxylon rubiginosum]|uniref:Uncharacterized protein n=1 Tax=Hypoxylon rubiginosum TaxID=110542 RepID=A0ACB9YN19_9PEZI|nr:hypothetical protein F4820DRAFT_436585 [Hypoxylon rubiginosum]
MAELYLLYAVATLAALLAPAAAEGNFTQSCFLWGIAANETSSSYDLMSLCTGRALGYNALHLDLCYTLVDGQIVEASNTAPGLGACEACSALLDGRLYCTGCPKDDGTLVDSSINMNNVISNQGGYLYCFDRRGDICTESPFGPWLVCDWWKYGY